MSFCSYFSFAKNKLKLFRFFEIAVITLNNYFGSLDLDNNSLVNNSFLAFLSAMLYSVFKVHMRNKVSLLKLHFEIRRTSICFANHEVCRCFDLKLVGLSGLEPPTSRLSGGRSNRLSYKPIYVRAFRPLVEMNGIEPMTPCLQSRCSPS